MITIREMSPQDLPLLEHVYLECRRSTFTWMEPHSFNLTDFIKDTEGEWILVAELVGKIVGFSSVWTQDHFLHHLYVLPEAQGRGVGRSLLEACFKGKLKRPARLKSVIQNSRACRFYESLGWKVESATEKGPMGPYATYVLES